MSEELRACPFCGRSTGPWGPVTVCGLDEDDRAKHWRVECHSCYGRTGTYDGPDGYDRAVESWNRRGYFGERQKITEDWLKSVGFKWAQFDRQPEKQWVSWIGRAILNTDGKLPGWMDSEDLGIHIGAHYRYEKGEKVEPPENWSCFFRSDASGWCHRFIHLRYVLYQDEVISLIESLTGQPWKPENVLYGQLWDTERASAMRQEDQKRIDRLRNLSPHTHPWTEAYKDRSRSKPLPEHVDAAIEGGKAK